LKSHRFKFCGFFLDRYHDRLIAALAWDEHVLQNRLYKFIIMGEFQAKEKEKLQVYLL
jgi:hypothetical protein